MNIDKRKLAIQILAVVGIAMSIKLAMIYYVANYEKYALSSFCSINDFIDCDGAARTSVSQFLGIPLAYWGILFYITVLFLTFVDKLKNIKFLKFLEVFKEPKAYIAVLGTVAFICSMVLAGISLFVIKKLCILCVITYFIDLLIVLISVNCIKDYILSYKTTFCDFIDGIKHYPKTFVILLILAISFFTYSGVTNNFIPHYKKSQEIKKYFRMEKNPYRVKGNILGNNDGDVVIELYSDFVCPLCYAHNIMLHKAVKEYKNIKIIHHNMPFDKECNTTISYNMHPGACYMARAALAAEKQNNYWEMSSLLYEKKPVNKEEMDKLVDELGFDKEKFYKDLNSEEIKNYLNLELESAENKGLDSTPTMYVNGEKHVGILPYNELQKLLEKHGAHK